MEVDVDGDNHSWHRTPAAAAPAHAHDARRGEGGVHDDKDGSESAVTTSRTTVD
jgi:hypothetical protein